MRCLRATLQFIEIHPFKIVHVHVGDIVRKFQETESVEKKEDKILDEEMQVKFFDQVAKNSEVSTRQLALITGISR